MLHLMKPHRWCRD